MSDEKDKKEQNNENENQVIEEQNQNVEEVSELDENEEVNELDQSFIAIDEDDDVQKANLWWDNLQKTLDEAGCEIDLTRPEDTARLNIVEYIKNGPDDYEFTNTYALDPEKRKIDIFTIKDDEVLRRQQTKDISDDVLVRMYNAAKNGNLFVTSLPNPGKFHKPRQIYVGENGLPKVGQDIDHISKEEADAMVFLDKPTSKEPEKPSDDIYEKAKKGDEIAQRKIELYDSRLKNYNLDVAAWARIQEIKENNPDLYKRSYNMAVIVQQYFQDVWTAGSDIASVNYNIRLTKLHEKYMRDKLPEEQRNAYIYLEEVTKKLKANGNALRTSLDGKIKGKLNFTSRKILSELFIYRDEILRVKNLIDTGDFKNLHKMSDEEFEQKTSALRESEQYKVGFLTLDAEELDNLLMSETDDKLLSRIDKLIKKTNDNSNANLEERKNITRDEVLRTLQEALNEGGFDIDVNSKEDLARLYISEIDKNNFCSVKYAVDPEQKPIDPETITKEETLNRLRNGFDEVTLDRIIKAAKEGRLFAEGHMGQKPPVGAKQIVLNDDKKFKISKRPEELTGDEAEIFEMIEKPKEVTSPAPGRLDKFLAFFGNKKAKTKINIYESAVRGYNLKMEKWNRVQGMDKTLRDRARNYSYTVSGFFSASYENEMDYKELLTELHRDGEIAKIDPVNNKKEREMELYYEGLRTEIFNISKSFMLQSDNHFVDSEDIINDANAFILANAFAARNEMLRIDKIRENKDFQNFEPKSSEQMSAEAMRLYNSPSFKEYAKNTTNATLITVFESIKTERYTYIAVIDEQLAEVMPEYGSIEESIFYIDDNKEKANNNSENENKVKNDAKTRAKLNEYNQAFGKCLMHLKNCEQKDLNVSINSEKADPDIAKTLAMLFTISEEMKNIGNRKENEWKSIKNLESDSKEFYMSDSFKEMSKYITVDEAMKVVNSEKVSPSDVINRVENLFDNADQKVKLESTIERPANKENVKEIKNPNANQFNL